MSDRILFTHANLLTGVDPAKPDSTVVVDSSVTLNRLQFDNDDRYIVAGAQDITFGTDPNGHPDDG